MYLNFINKDLKKYCKDKNFEVCGIKLNLSSKRFCIITIYRAATGNTDIFIIKLDTSPETYIPQHKNILPVGILI
jgi:hypothetical protein